MKQFVKIISCNIKNFGGIDNFSLKPNGKCFILKSASGAGKTSVFNALLMLAKKYPTAIVKQGTEKMETSIKVSHNGNEFEFVFNANEGENKPKITMKRNGIEEKGNVVTSTLKMLQGKEEFNFMDFVKATGQKKVEMLKTLVGLDLEEENDKLSEAESKRKFVKKLANEQKALVRNYDEELCEKEEVSTSSFVEQIKEAHQHNTTIERAKEKVSNLKKRNGDIIKEIKALEAEIESNTIRIKEGNEWISKNPTIDVSSLEVEAENTEEVNARIREAKQLKSEFDRYTDLEQQVVEAENKVQNVRTNILKKVENAKLPVEGFSVKCEINDKGRMNTFMTYKGIPFDETSINTGELIILAAKFQMELMKEGQLGLLHVPASLIDNEDVEELVKKANEHGVQLFFELNTRSKSDTEIVAEVYE